MNSNVRGKRDKMQLDPNIMNNLKDVPRCTQCRLLIKKQGIKWKAGYGASASRLLTNREEDY